MSDKDNKEPFLGKLSDKDCDLWAATAENIKKLKDHNIYFEPSSKSNKKNNKTVNNKEILFYINNEEESELKKTSQKKEKNTFKLNGEKISIQATLDLHGLNRAEAYSLLLKFIRESYRDNLRCVLIITGKGKNYKKASTESHSHSGVLREIVPRWLEAPAFSTSIRLIKEAKQNHGGKGAFYVILKRKNLKLNKI